MRRAALKQAATRLELLTGTVGEAAGRQSLASPGTLGRSIDLQATVWIAIDAVTVRKAAALRIADAGMRYAADDLAALRISINARAIGQAALLLIASPRERLALQNVDAADRIGHDACSARQTAFLRRQACTREGNAAGEDTTLRVQVTTGVVPDAAPLRRRAAARGRCSADTGTTFRIGIDARAIGQAAAACGAAARAVAAIAAGSGDIFARRLCCFDA